MLLLKMMVCENVFYYKLAIASKFLCIVEILERNID